MYKVFVTRMCFQHGDQTHDQTFQLLEQCVIETDILHRIFVILGFATAVIYVRVINHFNDILFKNNPFFKHRYNFSGNPVL